VTRPLTVSSVLSSCSSGRSDRDVERSWGRDDDRCRKAGDRGCGDPGCGHAPRLPRGRNLGPSGQAPRRVERTNDREGGYRRLLHWAEDFGPVRCAGVEGTSSYGAGLARHLRSRGIEVLEVEREVERPKHRRRSSRRNLKRRPIPRTPSAPHERYWPAKRRACPRAATAVWR
jgi:hypothetical protein